ncbi:Flp pilus assembly protein CpaB [Peribacillus alkalitolerans]|uniref:Flp pilus assembly protein CpaB n=1 Tax=Peribacillus alkalitolerans TaxID=1550385 RepID=UPI001F07F158|nr:flp pilus assembly protein CpaB [Peribacillus alkalitolerans]
MLESKRRAVIFLMLAFLLAATAGYMVLQKVKDLNSELGGMTKIYIANGDIPARTLIQSNQITTTEIPNKFVNPSHVLNKEELLNQVVVVPLGDKEIITKNMIKPYSNLRKEDNRLVAMYPSEKVQFDQVVEFMDRVDIIVSTKEGNVPKTEVFMRDVPVAYADMKNKQFSGVALEVSAEDAPKLIHIQNYADKVRVLKANVGKADELDTESEASVEGETTSTGSAPASKTTNSNVTTQSTTKPASTPAKPGTGQTDKPK